MTKEDKIRDRYYQKKYGITLDRYNDMLAEYDGCCWICRRPPTRRRLAVDHCHKWKHVKIETFLHKNLGQDIWEAYSSYQGIGRCVQKLKKNLAIQTMRSILKTVSCRGLLCTHCNLGLRKYADDPIRLTNAAEYLRNHQ